ncbi:MAG: class I tRNA ligase family protein, partial [Bdellovibrionales bacterium]|nr:class I tRNA ligase family protein [Bdellovibrionales bacterium]
LEWTESGIEGAWKYVNRVWRLATQPVNPAQAGGKADNDAMRRKIHKTIQEMTQDLDRFHFNKSVARLRELSNAIEDFSNAGGDADIRREGIETLIKIMAPLMPHLAEELWAHMGHSTLVVEEPWPKADTSLLANETVTIAIQVNGKMRATVQLPRDIAQQDAEKAALDDPAVQKALEGKAPKKIIVVPNRIINVVG